MKFDHNTLSSCINTTSGVLQGSVLGSLLFSLSRNDRGAVIESAKCLLLADDLQTYIACPPAELTERILHLNNDIRATSAWADSNSLRLILFKTKAIIFGNNRLINDSNTDLDDGTSNIPFESLVRNLGVVLDFKPQLLSPHCWSHFESQWGSYV